MYTGKQYFSPFLLAFLVWFCIFGEQAQPEIQPTEPDRLAKIERELEEKRKRLEQLDREEEQIFAELLELEERLDLTDRLIRRLSLQQSDVERALKEKQRDAKALDSTIYSYRESARNRLREIYKHGRANQHACAVLGSSPVDLASAHRFIQSILRTDEEFLSAAEALRTDVSAKRENLSRMRPELSRIQEREDQKRDFRLEELEEKERLLRSVESEKRLCFQAIEVLEKDAFSLQLEAGWHRNQPESWMSGNPESTGRFEAQRGKLPWPVRGTVASAFGLQRDGKLRTTTQNTGVEIRGKAGAEVVSVAAGTVVYSSSLRGYGNFLLVEHDGDYYTLYARLSEILISPGEKVERLQIIGRIGQNGPVEVPRLHFEIRKGKNSLDPLEWLR
jgi:septal ring factor EnvC (AmiA/AmiB activator)